MSKCRHLVISIVGVSREGNIEQADFQAMSEDYFCPEVLFSQDGLKLLRKLVSDAGWIKFVITGFKCL
ncbi:hypothetical protein [Providencia sp. Je.9.19]|uniref:hypothetical protein n=1 Tax=Providencia sp. Je.9.19 TaxID=3142844 RepID=UPI003DA7EF34